MHRVLRPFEARESMRSSNFFLCSSSSGTISLLAPREDTDLRSRISAAPLEKSISLPEAFFTTTEDIFLSEVNWNSLTTSAVFLIGFYSIPQFLSITSRAHSVLFPMNWMVSWSSLSSR